MFALLLDAFKIKATIGKLAAWRWLEVFKISLFTVLIFLQQKLFRTQFLCPFKGSRICSEN